MWLHLGFGDGLCFLYLLLLLLLLNLLNLFIMFWSDCVNSHPLQGSAIRGVKHNYVWWSFTLVEAVLVLLHQGPSFLEPTDLSCSGCFHHLYWCLLPFTVCPCHQQLVGSSSGIHVLVIRYSSGEQGMVEGAAQEEAGCCIFFLFIYFSKGSSISRSNLQLAQNSTFH